MISDPTGPNALLPNGNRQLADAKANLRRFIGCQAEATARLVGFRWIPTSDAPNDFLALRRAFLASSLTGRPLPVSDEHSYSTIYACPETNYAFRFWHDVVHVRLNSAFDIDGEITVARAQLDVLRAAGWGPGTLEFELLHADTLGQALCVTATGSFPPAQECFALRSVIGSVRSAIQRELHDGVDHPTPAAEVTG